MSKHADNSDKSILINLSAVFAVSPVVLAGANILFYAEFNPDLIKVLVVNLDIPRILMGALLAYLSLVFSACILIYNVSRSKLTKWSDNAVDTVLTLGMVYYGFYGPWPVAALPFFFWVAWRMNADLSKVVERFVKFVRIRKILKSVLEVLPATVMFVILALSVSNMWLPQEKITVGSKELSGYELNSSDGWTTFLISKDKTVKMVKTEDIDSKKLCLQPKPASPADYLTSLIHNKPVITSVKKC